MERVRQRRRKHGSGAASRRGSDAHFGKNLHDVTEDLHSPVDGCIGSQEVCVVQSLKRRWGRVFNQDRVD